MGKRSFAERYKADQRRKKKKGSAIVGLGIVVIVGFWCFFAYVGVSWILEKTKVVTPTEPKAQPPVEPPRLRGQAPVERKSDDTEDDPRTGLKVPVFWEPQEGELEQVHKIDGQPSIFLMVASYRDFQCRETVTAALERATYPSRLVIAVVDQTAPGDTPCDEPFEPCDQKPGQMLCQHHIKVYRMDSKDATGPVYARHVGYRMYRGEAFAMQVDAHVAFVKDWDESLIHQWEATGNEMAVLSTYLTDVQHSIKDGVSLRKTRPIMCNSDFEGRPPARYLRHGSQPEEEPVIKGEPMMQPFWAAGFSFGRGHFVHRVPYDCCLPMVFMGEEISIGIRGWTHGYDFYTPESSVVFHEYAANSARRHKVHMFWEQASQKRQVGSQSLKRLTALIGMAPDILDYDKTESEKYGLGKVRDVNEFYRLFLIDVDNRKATNLCKFVKTGVMHRHFKAAMTDHGVDLAQLASFDTNAAIEDELNQHWRPHARQALTKALEMKKEGWLKNAIDIAKRADFDKIDPDLIARAQAALREVKSV